MERQMRSGGGRTGYAGGSIGGVDVQARAGADREALLIHSARSLAFESRVLHLDRFCAVLVSLHGGVMQRVRLRGLIAAVAPAWIASDVPLPLGRAHQDSVARLVAVFKGDTPPQDVLGGSKEHEFREVILRLIHGAMRMLEHTGYGERAVGPRPVRALTDAKLTTSFVCVVNSCFETPDTCVAYYWQRIDRDGRIGDEGGGAAQLKVGKAYPVNSRNLGIFADVVGYETVKETGEEQNHLVAKRNKVGRLLKYIIDDRGTLRESPNGQLCVMSTEKAFET
ncbi:hypothetical protein B0T26DRAFT_871417 [Lasiosphaeria miniovina]|uniref:Uncharacterized protein n=1 Tax=Lasiosphaeria miniovina TaxID=1954250 RepID=A0AA40AJ19_9PEZI|nr:uncharacterized protein B0T26DRAFT_871417 [Lasiosphaeria miniovina]KAK0716756.1 hypothetical protein B0T26DRAFT_871417 [Lasiosphaeria miniovina]